MKNTKRILIAALAVIALSGITYFGTEYLLKDKIKEINIPGVETPDKAESGDKETSDIESVMNGKLMFYRLSSEGKIIKEELSVQGEDKLTKLMEYVLKTYGEYPENDVIKIPGNVKVIGYETKMGTLYLNISKELMESRIKDKKAEETFLDTLGSTLHQYSVIMGFQDYQIIIEGEPQKSIFGNTITDSPRLVFP